MSRHRVTIVQYLKAWREITVEIEAPNMGAAVERQNLKATPSFDNPAWSTEWELQNEQVFPAKSRSDLRAAVALDPVEASGEDDESFHDDEDSDRFLNLYKCDNCGHEWEDEWSCTCEDDCLACGARHMTPYRSEDAA